MNMQNARRTGTGVLHVSTEVPPERGEGFARYGSSRPYVEKHKNGR